MTVTSKENDKQPRNQCVHGLFKYIIMTASTKMSPNLLHILQLHVARALLKLSCKISMNITFYAVLPK